MKKVSNYNVCLSEIKTLYATIKGYKGLYPKEYLFYYLGKIDGYLQTIFYYNESKYHELENELKEYKDKIFAEALWKTAF